MQRRTKDRFVTLIRVADKWKINGVFNEVANNEIKISCSKFKTPNGFITRIIIFRNTFRLNGIRVILELHETGIIKIGLKIISFYNEVDVLSMKSLEFLYWNIENVEIFLCLIVCRELWQAWYHL